MIKRGCTPVFVHFHSFPFTNKESQEKAKQITKLLADYQLRSKIYLVPFAEIQRHIMVETPLETRVILYRRYMLRLAERIAQRERARVLVVNDDLTANETVIGALRDAQLDVWSTQDSVVAWQWVNGEQFDLIVLSMEMPVLNGFELCKRLRMVRGYEKTPVIFVSSRDDVDSRARSSLTGADDLVAKPFLPQELAAKVVMHLVRRQMLA